MEILGEFLLIVLGLQALILAHELAHAVVGKAVGLRCVQIVIGIGRPLFRWRGMEWCAVPIGGRCRFDSEAHSRLAKYQMAAIALAGPLANLLLAWVLSVVGAPIVLVHMSMVLGVINLVPLPRTDGWQALTQLVDKPQLASFSVNPWVVQGVLTICAILVLV